MEKISLPMFLKKLANPWTLLCVSLVVIILLCLTKCSGISDKQLDQIVNHSDSSKYFKDKYNQEVATNSAILLSSDEQIRTLTKNNKQLSESISHFKSIISAAQVKSEASFKNMDFAFTFDTTKTEVCDTGKAFCPETVKEVKIDSCDIQMEAHVYPDHFHMDFLTIPDQEIIAVGYKKTGLLSSQLTIDVTHTNKSIHSNLITGYVVHETKWYENHKTQFVAGCLIGGFIGLELHQLAK